MTVDLQSRPVAVTIHDGTDALNCSPIYESLNLDSNGLDQSGWIHVTGTLRLLAFVDGFAESCDRRVNPTRFALGNVVAVSVDFGGATGLVSLPWRLKILELPDRPHPEQTYIDIKVGGDAQLKGYRGAEGSAGGVTYGSPTNRDTLINAMLTEAGLPALTDAISSFPIPFAPQKVDASSWADYLGQVAYTGNYLLWQQSDGAVRARALALTGLSPIAHYTLGVDDVRILPSPGDKSPPAKVIVTGTTYNLTALDEDSTTVADIVEDAVTVGSITTEYQGRGTATPTKIVTHRRKLGDVLPKFFPGNNTQFDFRRQTSVSDYSPVSGILDQTLETLEEAAGLVIPELISSGHSTLIIRTRTTTDYSYDSKKIVNATATEVEEPRALVFPSTWATNPSQPTTAERIVDSWDRIGPDTYDPTRNTANSREDKSQSAQFTPAPDKPPATQYQPPSTAKEEVPFSGEADFEGLGGTDFADKPWTIATPGGLVGTIAQCEAIAQLWGEIRHGRAWPVAWAGGLTPAFLSSWSPAMRFDVTLNSGRTAYLIEGFTLQMDTRSQSVGGLGIEIGTVASDGSGAPTRPFVQP